MLTSNKTCTPVQTKNETFRIFGYHSQAAETVEVPVPTYSISIVLKRTQNENDGFLKLPITAFLGHLKKVVERSILYNTKS
jgi:hypothetical protein